MPRRASPALTIGGDTFGCDIRTQLDSCLGLLLMTVTWLAVLVLGTLARRRTLATAQLIIAEKLWNGKNEALLF